MKKLLVNLSLVVSLFFAGQITYTPKADAALLGAVIASIVRTENWVQYWDTGDWTVCLFLLPFCVFDKPGMNPGNGISVSDLTKNRYSSEEASQIINGQHAFLEKMKAADKRLVLGDADSKETVEAQILSVYPEAPAVYVDFLTTQMGL